MRLPATLTLFLTTTLALPSTPNGPNTTINPLSIQMANSIISRREGIYTPTQDSSGPLQAGFVQKALTLLLAQYPSRPSSDLIEAYITQSADSLLRIFANATSAGRYSMDRLSSGNAFISLSQTTGKGEYAHAVEVLKESVDLNKRTKEDGLWYYVYPNWSYLDGMFSFGPFWARYTAAYDAGNGSAWGELGRQFGLLAEHCAFDPASADTRQSEAMAVADGLLVHGYDASRTAVWANNSLGQSPHVWGRSLGWYVLGLLDTITVLDESDLAGNTSAVQRLRDSFVGEFQLRMRAVARSVDGETGAWWQVMDQPGREGNYIESSASAMFVAALLRGSRKGYLPSGCEPTSHVESHSDSHPSSLQAGETGDARELNHVDIAARAYNYLKDTFVVDNGNGTLGWNGTVSVCSLNSTASYEYYVGRPILYDSVLGSAAFVEASLEVEMLGGQQLRG